MREGFFGGSAGGQHDRARADFTKRAENVALHAVIHDDDGEFVFLQLGHADRPLPELFVDDVALRGRNFFGEVETVEAAWSPDTTDLRTVLPTGLGWFVQTYRGEPVVWHSGLIANGYSSLIVKLPSRRLTFILFANSDGLSSPVQFETGDVTRSLFATLFLRLYT